jgi:hypothetical protein
VIQLRIYFPLNEANVLRETRFLVVGIVASDAASSFSLRDSALCLLHLELIKLESRAGLR